MKANWSLVLNVILLFGVFFAITRLILLRKKEIRITDNVVNNDYKDTDDIIAVRKLDSKENLDEIGFKLSPTNKNNVKTEELNEKDVPKNQENQVKRDSYKIDCSKMIMIFISAKEHQEFAGYELLQSLLASGLRFGEGNIFHKYQKTNGQGAVLFSLAAATQTGTFDLQTMGSCSVRGLCIYMYLSGNHNIDSERFNLMYETAKSLAEDLNANLLDDKQNIFSSDSLDRYNSYINVMEEAF